RLRSTATAAATAPTTAACFAGQRQFVALHFAVVGNLNIGTAKVLSHLKADFHAIGFSVADLNRSTVSGLVCAGHFATVVLQLNRDRGRAAASLLLTRPFAGNALRIDESGHDE